MSEISLRAYVEYIDERLARDALGEVITQCRHVLDTYPKYIEVYKLLARAVMAQEKYQDALDLFQRVLSADPSDFIAHIGISDCYRISGSIDQAIWHLERAFEQVPNNLDLQEAIKELYHERGSGIPRKIQLTGGALARLYQKGKLYPQAIHEIKKTLVYAPERLDLKILLADALWHNHQIVDGGKVAAEVLKQLPNSIDAIRILAQLWLKANRSKEAEQFLGRLRELDPYLAYEVEHQGQKAASDLYQLEMLDYTIARYASEIGAADWVSQIQSIPKARGVTGPLNASPDTGPPGEVQIAPADSTAEHGTPDWLQEALDSPLAQRSARETATPPAAEAPLSSPPPDDTPDWLKDVLPGLSEPPSTQPEPPITDEPPPMQPPSPEPPQGEADWMQDMQSAQTEEPSRDATNTPDWLQDVLDNPAQEESPAAPPPLSQEMDDTPIWLKDALEKARPAPAPTSTPQSAQSEDWLSEILGDAVISSQPQRAKEAPAERQPPAADAPGAESAFADFPPESPAAGDSDTPDWLSDALDERAATLPQTSAPGEVRQLADEDRREAPSWLNEIMDSGRDEVPRTPGADVSQPQHQEVTDDWLSELLSEPAPSAETPAGIADGSPDWLADMDSPSAPEISTPPVDFDSLGELETWDDEPASPPAEPPEPKKEASDEAELPPFLSGTQDEPRLFTPRTKSDTEIPEWLKSADDLAQKQDDQEDDLPDWLKES